MKVTAKHNVNYNGEWHVGGEQFELDNKDFDGLAECVEAVKPKTEEFVSEVFPPDDEQPKRARRKKTVE